MSCLICGEDIGMEQQYLALYRTQLILMEEAGKSEPLQHPVATGDGFHLGCIRSVLLGAATESEEKPPITSYPAAGYCDTPGCTNKVYSTPEGDRCALGHEANPLFKPYREGDQD